MLVQLGLDHRQADLDIRERFHVADEDVRRISGTLGMFGAAESVLTRTCNRVEIYTWWPREAETNRREIPRHIGHAWVGPDQDEVERLLGGTCLRTGDAAVRHLFRVSSGLESQIVGDIHILGQVRRSLNEAVAVESVGSHLQRLFETALRVGKQVQRGTRLMALRPSVGSAAARYAATQLGDLENLPCVVVGCGKSGAQAARTLRRLGARDLTVLNRTVSTAEQLAADVGATRSGGLDQVGPMLESAALVIVATGSPDPILRRRDVATACGKRSRDTPLLIVDVSVPRNVEVEVGRLAGVDLVDLDSLQPTSAEDERVREQAVHEAEAMVEEAVAEFRSWLMLRPAGAALMPFREALLDVCRRELAYLTGEANALADRAASRIVARMMAHPMTTLREASERGESVRDAADAVALLFSGPRSRSDLMPETRPPVESRRPLALPR